MHRAWFRTVFLLALSLIGYCRRTSLRRTPRTTIGRIRHGALLYSREC